MIRAMLHLVVGTEQILDKSKMRLSDFSKVRAEAEILHSLKHKNIIRFKRVNIL